MVCMDKENFVDWQSLIDEAHEKLVGEKAKRIRIICKNAVYWFQ